MFGKTTTHLLAMLAFTLLVVLVACSGGGDDSNNDNNDTADATATPDVAEVTTQDSQQNDGASDDTAQAVAQDPQVELVEEAVAEAEAIPGFDNVFAGEVNAHLYLFTGAVGDVVSIGMVTQNPQLDPYLVLMGPTGAVYAANDDAGDGTVFAAIDDFELPEAGTYFVLATSARGLAEGPVIPEGGDAPQPQPYRLTYEGVTEVVSINLEDVNFTTLDIGRGESAEITLSQESPIQYILLEGDVENPLTISTAGEDFFTDTIIHLFDAGGNRVGINDDDQSRESTYATLRDFAFPENGTYLAIVTVFNFFQAYDENWQDGQQFTLTIE